LVSGRPAGTRPGGTVGSQGSASVVAVTPARSRKVRRILRFEARAQRLLARYERALAQATRAMGQARALLDDASLLEGSLTGTQLGELRRGRAGMASTQAAASATPPDRPTTLTPT